MRDQIVTGTARFNSNIFDVELNGRKPLNLSIFIVFCVDGFGPRGHVTGHVYVSPTGQQVPIQA